MSKKLVPKLRFPEFSGEWEVKKLVEILKEAKLGGNYENSESNLGFPVIKMGNISRGVINLEKIQYLPETELFNEDDVLKVGDLLFNTRNTLELVGKVAVWRDELPKALYNSNILRLKFKEEYVKHNFFMNYLFNTKKTINRLRSYATGTTSVAAIYGRDLHQLKLFLPPLYEQEKVSEFLEKIDAKIHLLTKKKELLEQYKKGVMGQIFSQIIRFKDDKDNPYPAWENKRLENIGDFIGGGTPDTLVYDYWNGQIQWFTPTELKFKYVYKSNRTITALGLAKSSAKLLPSGTLLLSTRATIGDVSIAIGDCCTNQGFQSIVVNKENDNEFIYYWLIKNKNKLIQKASGSIFLEISKTEVSKIQIMLPELEEQKKISIFLSSIDNKINSTSLELDDIQTYKKYLLQQMFI